MSSKSFVLAASFAIAVALFPSCGSPAELPTLPSLAPAATTVVQHATDQPPAAPPAADQQVVPFAGMGWG